MRRTRRERVGSAPTASSRREMKMRRIVLLPSSLSGILRSGGSDIKVGIATLCQVVFPIRVVILNFWSWPGLRYLLMTSLIDSLQAQLVVRPSPPSISHKRCWSDIHCSPVGLCEIWRPIAIRNGKIASSAYLSSRPLTSRAPQRHAQEMNIGSDYYMMMVLVVSLPLKFYLFNEGRFIHSYFFDCQAKNCHDKVR
ncbi:hypothetical protein PRIPAC_74437 [Pristionchus pacificus]|uniref:Uncharacterized protein n=1 Tax=Pristionchus pacificus TaxID=54126 RepID=A0A2A6CFX5_PRIPA|nr:hypothetical protein PRIPAC_74437 [Pristionchus pacificus]|eukprot:PDM77112.1 hypothetical protein PRIPAC_43024 [Pristionchus pacificus]